MLPTGGNQRELARQKNAKKAAAMGKSKAAADKGGNKGASLEQRKHRYTLVTDFTTAYVHVYMHNSREAAC